MHGGMNEELWLSHAEEMRPQLDLLDRIWDELHWATDTDTADVYVWVDDFVATLTGTVRSSRARIAIEQATERVHGVHRVINQLAVEDLQAVR